jgi:hypothetical protein
VTNRQHIICTNGRGFAHKIGEASLLMRRAAMLNRAIFWAVIGSIAVTLLVIVAFASAFFAIAHERGVAILFVVSLAAFTVSLVDFAREVRIALSEFDHYA